MALANRATKIERPNVEGATTTKKPSFPVVSLILGTLSFIGIMISIWMIFLYAPTDAIEGQPQRIFYVHLSVAIPGMLAFGIVALGGIMYIWKKDERWDWTARDRQGDVRHIGRQVISATPRRGPASFRCGRWRR